MLSTLLVQLILSRYTDTQANFALWLQQKQSIHLTSAVQSQAHADLFENIGIPISYLVQEPILLRSYFPEKASLVPTVVEQSTGDAGMPMAMVDLYLFK